MNVYTEEDKDTEDSEYEVEVEEEEDEEEGEEEEEEEEHEQTEKEELTDEYDAWNVGSDQSDEGEKYWEAFYEAEEVGEAEKEIPLSSTVSTTEKSEEEVRPVEESGHVPTEISIEVSINLSFSLVLPVELLFLTTFVIH